MLAIIRFIVMTLALVFICCAACIYSILRPFHRNNVFHTSHYLSKVSTLLGLTIEVRIPESIKDIGPAVYICNHQNSYDIFTVSAAVQPSTVSVGKKSLKWIPFFGQMYWLTGNILIDRSNSSKAINTIALTAKKITEKELSVWLFPEGTRSNGKGLLPFKTGAFRTAQQANVPIIPVCVSNLHGKIKLGRWNNGKLIIELLEPIYFNNQAKESIREVANTAHKSMLVKIAELSKESGNELILKNKV
ncbi:acyl-phosphate glycerol 3-phosphate acyltransferase [Colwellia sp. PAMC 20917]|uniref:1-acylglycerol-3-phosphate O-acyltransferase n=1 Tax=Colwellia sp. PAMC 20917 TaxID=1816218 RepID=UPI0008785552|nr:1-acylglycerol-3-phosphate O-acyltransferase [Colwellia sp. PAMC 20917]AOW77701.1 acyl-phosphate glycerol 3-phosphate acyltransferase [Colwellia sp. PAMC 20917]